MHLKITKRAQRDMSIARKYIAQDSEDAAIRVLMQVKLSMNRLLEFPSMGRIGRVKGTRELVLSENSYILAYRVNKETVEILSLLHTSRIWPEIF